MIKLPTLAEICGAVKYSYEYSNSFNGVTLLLKDGSVFTAWEDGTVEVPHPWNVPGYAIDLENAIKTFIKYQKG